MDTDDQSTSPREANRSVPFLLVTDIVARPPRDEPTTPMSLGENVLLLGHIIAVSKQSSGNPPTSAFQN